MCSSDLGAAGHAWAGHAHHHGHSHGHGAGHDHSQDDSHAHAHDHSHGHAHGHSHGHSHVPADYGRAFVIAVLLNTGFVIVEVACGFLANSTALLADAWHNLSDVLGLLLAWGAAVLSRRVPSGRYTYGLRGSSILAALANAVFLLVACGAIAWEALLRLSQPPEVAGTMVTLVACVGIVVNGISALLFVKGSGEDMNIRGAYLHMAADAAVSLGVVVTGVIMATTGWFWLDPVSTLVIVAIIVYEIGRAHV